MARRAQRPRRFGPTAAARPSRVRQGGAYLITLVLLGISLWMLANFIGQVLTSAQIERSKAELEAEIAQLEAEKLAIEREVAYAESPAYVEQIAREQLGLARDGDVVILPTFPDAAATTPTPAPTPLPAPTPQPNWQGWQRALFPPAEAP